MNRSWQIIVLCVGSILGIAGCDTGSSASQPFLSAQNETAAAERTDKDADDLWFSQQSTVQRQEYEKKNNYQDFLRLARPFALIPGLREGMVPQGLAVAKDWRILISAYGDSVVPSIILVLDKDGGLIADYKLYNEDGSAFSGHVGGIAVSEDQLWLSVSEGEKNAVAEIPLSELDGTGNGKLVLKKRREIPVTPSYMNYSQGILWVGNFYYPEGKYPLSGEMDYLTETADGEYGGYLLGYDLSRQGQRQKDSGEEKTKQKVWLPDMVLAVPDRIQGMVCMEDGRIMLSQSYGRKNESSIKIYAAAEFDRRFSVGENVVPGRVLDRTCMIEELSAMPMAEGMDSRDGSVFILFESGALHYEDGKDRTDYIWEMKMKGM